MISQRILTGKQEKINNADRQRIKEERLRERFEFENFEVRADSTNGYELIFPVLHDDEKNELYEHYIKSANDIWDEFTTGKNSLKTRKKFEPQTNEIMKKEKAIERKKAMVKQQKPVKPREPVPKEPGRDSKLITQPIGRTSHLRSNVGMDLKKNLQ